MPVRLTVSSPTQRASTRAPCGPGLGHYCPIPRSLPTDFAVSRLRVRLLFETSPDAELTQLALR
jgi:hypothetical protein